MQKKKKKCGSVDVCIFLRRLIFIRFSKSSAIIKQQSQAPKNISILGNASMTSSSYQ